MQASHGTVRWIGVVGLALGILLLTGCGLLSKLRKSGRCLWAESTAPVRNNYDDFLRYSLMAQRWRHDGGDKSAHDLFDNVRYMSGFAKFVNPMLPPKFIRPKGIEYFRTVHGYHVEGLGGFSTTADEYIIITTSVWGIVRAPTRMVLVTPQMKRAFPWITANAGDWLVDEPMSLAKNPWNNPWAGFRELYRHEFPGRPWQDVPDQFLHRR